MTQRLDKVRKLVRFREFRESTAADGMRQRLVETRQAVRALDVAQAAVDEAESWKARSFAGGNIDVVLYGFALENEQEMVGRRDAATSDLKDSRERMEVAGNHWHEAASATRVARERALAESRLVMDIEDKRMFDQLSDLLLSRQGDRHD